MPNLAWIRNGVVSTNQPISWDGLFSELKGPHLPISLAQGVKGEAYCHIFRKIQNSKFKLGHVLSQPPVFPLTPPRAVSRKPPKRTDWFPFICFK